jgi:3-oxoacyl-[acyl-carrier protein] reductase
VHGLVGACERLPILSEVANTAAFVASDSAGGVTGTVLSLSAGFSTD